MRFSFRISALAVGLSAASAFAGPFVTINLTGTVTSPSFGGISYSSAVSASITYDTASTPTSVPNSATAFFATSTLKSFVIGASGHKASGGRQAVHNNNGQFDTHQHLWSSIDGPSQGGLFATQILIQADGGTSILSTQTHLPTATQQSLFTTFYGSMQFSNSGSTQTETVTFDFTGVEIIENPVVPLPTGAAMAMVGMGVIGVRRRRS